MNARLFMALALAALVANAAAQAPAAQPLFFDGFELLRQGQYGQAEAKFRQGLALEPGNARAHLYLGDALSGRKDFAAARAEYEQAARAGAPDIAQQAQQRLAQLPAPAASAAPRANADAARASLLKALALAGQPFDGYRDERALIALGEALAELGDQARAQQALTIAVDQATRNAERSAKEAGSLSAAQLADHCEQLARAARAQVKAGDAAGAARTLAAVERFAGLVRGDGTEEPRATALTHVAFGYAGVGDAANANRVFARALDVANRAQAGAQSGIRAKIAIARFRSGDAKGALSMEDLVKQRDARFLVGHAWPEVMEAMAQVAVDWGQYQNVPVIFARAGDDVGVITSVAYGKFVEQAIERGRLQEAEDMVPRITKDDERFDALNKLALAYAARQRKGDAQRMLARLRDFGDGHPGDTGPPGAVSQEHVDETLPAVLLALGLAEEAQRRAAAAKDKDVAAAALARGTALAGDYRKAIAMAGGFAQDYQRSGTLDAIARDCAFSDTACELEVLRSPAFPKYAVGGVLAARVRAGDVEGAQKLIAALGAADEGAEAGREAARVGRCDDALRFEKYTGTDYAFWTLVGRCQAGLLVLTIQDTR